MLGKRLLVIGAGGEVGRGIVSAARSRGMRLIAAGRSAERLADLEDHDRLAIVTGDVATMSGALNLWKAAQKPFDGVDAVVVAINAPNVEKSLRNWTKEEMAHLYEDNFLTHFNAIQAMLPLLSEEGILIGIGGGTADFILPGLAPLSMMQAAQRMMYRGFAKERRGGAHVRELMLTSMINGASKRRIAEPHWILDTEVGEHICAILADPAAFPGPILRLETRAQIGRPHAPRQESKS